MRRSSCVGVYVEGEVVAFPSEHPPLSPPSPSFYSFFSSSTTYTSCIYCVAVIVISLSQMSNDMMMSTPMPVSLTNEEFLTNGTKFHQVVSIPKEFHSLRNAMTTSSEPTVLFVTKGNIR